MEEWKTGKVRIRIRVRVRCRNGEGEEEEVCGVQSGFVKIEKERR